MKVSSRQFGELEFDDKHVILFPQGIAGFKHLRRFLVLNDEESEPFRWLVSLDDAGVALPVIEPDFVQPGYRPELKAGHTVLLVSILTSDPSTSTVNLRSPIVIEQGSQVGRQLILDDDGLSVHYPLVQPQLNDQTG
jgi:flagellar assembly factor FliW